MSELEFRSATVRSAKRGRRFDARAVSYHRVDDFGTVWLPGVFDDYAKVRLPRILWGHDFHDIIGRATSTSSRADGFHIAAELSDPGAVPRARQAAAQLADGTIDQVSVGFTRREWRRPTAEEQRKWPGAEEVMVRAECDEVSLVLRGAVPGADVLAVRERRQLARDLARGRISVAQYRARTGRRSSAHDAKIDEAIEIALRGANGVRRR